MAVIRKRTWAEISLDNIEHNFKEMKARLREGTRFLGVVKADAYGHGAIQTALLLQEIGCDYLAVACIDEAVQLRENGIILPILILGYTAPEYAGELIKHNVTATIIDLEQAKAMSDEAEKCCAKLKVHLKVDSGMGRLGFVCREAGEDPETEMLTVMELPGLEIEGIFTHFAVSDVLDDKYTDRQFAYFTRLIERLEEKTGIKFKIKHCTNSGAMINYDWTYLDMVRPGIALYGCYPDKDKGGLELRPAMALRTRIVQVKDTAPGESISYGRTYMADKKLKTAVIPVGYADGLHRVLSGKIEVLVHGRRVQQVGRICMDMCMIDVTGIENVRPGDVVTIFGQDGDVFIPVEEYAEKAGTISYELLCAVSPRVERVYLRKGEEL